MHRRARRRFVFVLGLGLLTVLVCGTFAQSQGQTYKPQNDKSDKRNTLSGGGRGEIYGSNVAEDCWAHHAGEGMRDTVIVYPVVPTQLKVGQRSVIPVQLTSGWTHDLIAPISIEVSLLGDPMLAVEGQAANAAAARDIRDSERICLGPTIGFPVVDPPKEVQKPVRDRFCPTLVSIPIDIPSGATHIVAHAKFVPGAGAPPPQATGAPQETYGFGFRYDDTRGWNGNADPRENTTHPEWLRNETRSFSVPLSGMGRGLLEVEHSGSAVQTAVYVNYTLIMGAEVSSNATRSYSIRVPHERIAQRTAEYVEIPVTPFRKGVQDLEIKVRSGIYYQHNEAGTASTDYFTRYAVLDQDNDLIRGSSITAKRHVVVGDAFIPSPYVPADAPIIETDWRLVLAEVSGFSAAGLLLPSLLLGGTYGKGTRRFFNTVLGGAKRRVMFHNMVSLGLSLVAFVHILLFMLEARYTIVMGVMWGGLGALSLLVLGLTGYYQVPLIQRHGYRWWRFTHLVFGLFVVFFVSYHAIADGPDFFFIKEQLPKWLNDLNMAQK